MGGVGDACDPGCDVNADCDDASACTADRCDGQSGICHNEAVSCDDGNACTADSCDAVQGCQNVNQCPDCGGAGPTVATLWPPNHELVPVGVRSVTDPQGQATTIRIDSVTQDEPTEARRDGRTCGDGSGVGSATASLRAERSGLGDGRV
jgi:hypothetical protein